MDASAVNFNVTTDDFDSILSYADQGAWQTPDPSSASYDPKTSQWLLGTFHSTNVTGATVEFNFTGPAIYVFGAAGPAFGSYEVTIDGSSVTKSAYLPSDAASPYMLYGADNLSYADHTLRLRNLGKQGADAGGGEFLFDFLRTTVQLGPAGATVKNQTLEETDSAFKYKGVWGSNKSGNFSGGGSTYTNADNASVSFSFHGSAIYMFGDKKNDHGLYTVVLDGGEPQVFNGISGCGGAFGMTCEQQQPTLAYFASNLDGGLHNLTLTNNAGVNQSYFDLDSVVLSVPSEYAPRTLGDAASSAGGNASSASGSGSAPSASATAGQNGAVSFSGAPLFNPLLCLIGGVLWLLRSEPIGRLLGSRRRNELPTEFYIDPNGEAAAAKLWSVYVSEAEKYDKSLVESWKSDMEGILIFAGLFSASLTAFIIESYPTLVPDSGDATVLLLAQISQQLAAAANGSTAQLPAPLPPFSPPTTSLVCNTFWFISLGFSLSCALIATLVEQWARDFLHKADMRSAPGVRARIFSFLYYGLKEFSMHKVVDVIPLLLHASLFLFFAGLVAFLIPINIPMAAVAACMLACITVVYSTLTILPLHYLDCPYRTPLSEAFWGLSRRLCRRRSRIPAEEDDSAEPTMSQAMSQAAIEATSDRDYRALVWTVKSLADETEFEPFAEAVPDVLWGPDYPRWSYRNHIKNLMQHPDLDLHRRFVELHRSCDSGLLKPELAKRRRVTCYKALWALGSVGALVDIQLLGLEAFEQNASDMGEYSISEQAMKSLLSKLVDFLDAWDLEVEVDLAPHLESVTPYLLDHQGPLSARNPVLSYQLYHLGAFPSSEVIPVLVKEIHNILNTKVHSILVKFLVASTYLGSPPYRYNETLTLIRSNSSTAFFGLNQNFQVALSQIVGVGFHKEIRLVDSVQWFDRMVLSFCSLWQPPDDGSASVIVPEAIIEYLCARKSDDAVGLLLGGPGVGMALWDAYLWRVISLDAWRGEAYEYVLDALLDKLKDQDPSPVATSVIAMLKANVLNVLVYVFSTLPASPYLSEETSIPIPDSPDSQRHFVSEGMMAVLGEFLEAIQFQPTPYKAADTIRFITKNIVLEPRGLRVHEKHQNRIADGLAGLWSGDEPESRSELLDALLFNAIFDVYTGYSPLDRSVHLWLNDRMARGKIGKALKRYADYLSQLDDSPSLPRVRAILRGLDSLHSDSLDSN